MRNSKTMMTLKVTILFCLALFGLVVFTTIVSAKSSQPFTLSIRPLTSVAKVGSKVRVLVILTNTSDHEIGILKSTPESDYMVEVRDSVGNVAPDTDFGRKQKAPDSVKVSTATPLYSLKPGDSLRDEISINLLCDISRPDKYSVQISRTVPEEIGSGVVKSNVVTVTVVP